MKNLLVRAHLRGRGIVNYDDKLQKHTLIEYKMPLLPKDLYIANNIQFAKKDFYFNENEQRYEYCLKISSLCIRNAMFKEATNDIATITNNPLKASLYMLSPESLIKGYLFASQDTTFKRGTCQHTTDAKAVPVDGKLPVSHIEIFNKEGERSDTSFFYKETCGAISYVMDAMIDPSELMLIVTDPYFDRMAIDSDWVEGGYVDKAMKMHYGNIGIDDIYKVGYFTKKAVIPTNAIPERGILLSTELVDYLIRYALKKILGIGIYRASSFAEVDYIDVKIVNNILKDKRDDEYGWIRITKEEDIDSLNFSIENPYVESTDDEVALYDNLKEKSAACLKERREKKEEDKKARKAKKEANNQNEDNADGQL